MYIPIPLNEPPKSLGEVEFRLYLKRIGAGNEFLSEKDCLFHLHQRHLLSVPFENLDIMTKVPIRLSRGQLYDKIVIRKRGGFCYELNGLFAWMLECYGFSVRMLSARVVNNVFNEQGRYEQTGIGPEFDHLVLLVDTRDGSYLADVGFGGLFIQPLKFEIGREVVQRVGTFRVEQFEGDEYSVQKLSKNQWIDCYRFTLREYRLEDFTDMCLYHSTNPNSHFTTYLNVQLLTENGRAGLRDYELSVKDSEGTRHKTLSSSERAYYLEHLFGMLPSEIEYVQRAVQGDHF